MNPLKRLRGLGVALAVVTAALLPVAGGASPACAGSREHAALVIDTGSQTYKYCVALNSSSVSGMDLIKLASSQYGLQYSLGFGSKAVCQLAGVGVSGGDCFSDYPNFWGYWRGTGSGGWSWSSTGAADTSVSAGDIEGWSWGKGQDPSAHPTPPSTTYEDVCGSIDSGGSGGTGGGGTGGTGGGGGGGGGDSTGGDTTGGGGQTGGKDTTTGGSQTDSSSKHSDTKTTDEPSPTKNGSASPESSAGGGNRTTTSTTGSDRQADALASTAPDVGETPAALAAAAPQSPSGGGFSGGNLAALLAIVILAGAGAFVARRRLRYAGRHERKG